MYKQTRNIRTNTLEGGDFMHEVNKLSQKVWHKRGKFSWINTRWQHVVDGTLEST